MSSGVYDALEAPQFLAPDASDDVPLKELDDEFQQIPGPCFRAVLLGLCSWASMPVTYRLAHDSPSDVYRACW